VGNAGANGQVGSPIYTAPKVFDVDLERPARHGNLARQQVIPGGSGKSIAAGRCGLLLAEGRGAMAREKASPPLLLRLLWLRSPVVRARSSIFKITRSSGTRAAPPFAPCRHSERPFQIGDCPCCLFIVNITRGPITYAWPSGTDKADSTTLPRCTSAEQGRHRPTPRFCTAGAGAVTTVETWVYAAAKLRPTTRTCRKYLAARANFPLYT